MALFPINLPPGLYRSGTALQSSGRFYDANLIRWQNGALQPIGGWAKQSLDTVAGKARAIRVWTDNAGSAKIAIGTHTGLYAMDRPGNLYDITPAGYVAGRADSDSQGGYGNDFYGKGFYGTPRPFSLDPHDVTVWSLDNFGQYLVACTADDGTIYEWRLNTSVLAAPVANAPTARALFVTSERNLVALGADGNPSLLAWSNQGDNTDWTDSTTNYAGSFPLQTTGKLMCGRRVRGGSIVLTTTDAWLMSFVGQPLVYAFEQKGGAGTGIVSQGAIAVMDGEAVPVNAVWMGQESFFGYNGNVQVVECEVAGEVFSNINRAQISKVTAFHNADWGEVTWFYPSQTSLENDSYVTWNYRENWWCLGQDGIRLSGCEKGPLQNPLAVSDAGWVYKHEYGLDYEGAEPFAETGPFLIGQGDRIVEVLKIIPDEKTLGDVTTEFFTRLQPEGTETTRGPYSLSQETSVRWAARMFRARFTGARLAPWRVGNFKLDGAQRGKR